MNNIQEREEKVQLAIEIAIKVGLLALVILISYLIAKPFIGIVVWGIIIAVALSPLINNLEKRFGNRKRIIIGFTVAVIAALLILHLIVVVYMGIDITSINISKLFSIVYVILIAMLLYRITNTIAYLKMESIKSSKVLRNEVINLLIKVINSFIILAAFIVILKIFINM